MRLEQSFLLPSNKFFRFLSQRRQAPYGKAEGLVNDDLGNNIRLGIRLSRSWEDNN
jgi:hypothetical protein